MLKYYRSSFIFSVVALIVGYIMGGLPIALIIGILGILETSLSFDNAVVNASVLKNWDAVWRARFINWGLPVAVFGMRLAFPLLIVGVVAHLNPIEAISLAVSTPSQYEIILTSVHNQISAFGGAFLMLVFLNFFISDEKDTHWIGIPEAALASLSKFSYISYILTFIMVAVTTQFIPQNEVLSFVLAGLAGISTYAIVQWLGSLVGGNDASAIVKQGVVGLLYLELLDASFSFDGVIAAFALTNHIFVIMIGLSVGAMFVRSMTLHLVDKGTLAQFRWLEHGAFWAIGVLACIMFLGPVIHISELFTGLVGAVAIGTALWSSMNANKTDALGVREVATIDFF